VSWRIKHSCSCVALTLALTPSRRFWTTTSPSLTLAHPGQVQHSGHTSPRSRQCSAHLQIDRPLGSVHQLNRSGRFTSPPFLFCLPCLFQSERLACLVDFATSHLTTCAFSMRLSCNSMKSPIQSSTSKENDAIHSHRWAVDMDEVSYEDMLLSTGISHKKGFARNAGFL